MNVIRSTQPLRIAALAAATAALSLSLVGTASAAAPKVGPTTTAFYAPSASKIKGGKNGDVIWYRTAQSALALSNASRVLNVVYKSKSLANKSIGVSGTVWLPKGTPPAGGWKVISWGHGTTGAGDSCAPSRIADIVSGNYSSYVYPAFNAWLAAGYAVAMSDYEGLGTPGPHPYLIGHSEGRGVIDIVTAAHNLDSHVGSNWIAAGHSQGGHAVLFAAADARTWAPSLHLKGVAAFAPASHLKTTVIFATSAIKAPNGISGLGALIVRSTTVADPTLKLSDLMNPAAYALMGDLETKCLGGDAGLGSVGSFGQFAPGNLLKTWTGSGWTSGKVLKALTALDGPAINPSPKNNSKMLINVPMLLLQGGLDSTVPSFTTDALVAEMRTADGAGNVGYNTYPSADHGGVVGAGQTDATAWFATQFAR
jgi:alpha-beta hydrolase superfamily lysophospholipase